MTDITPLINNIQVEEVSYQKPVSEGLLKRIGAAINYANYSYPPVGTIVASILTEAQFSSNDAGGFWCLADGRSCSGSVYETVTGNATVPDLRGAFLRGKDHGIGRNADGDLALGTYTDDKFEAHTHTETTLVAGQMFADASPNGSYVQTSAQTSSTGGNETAPKNITINWFIKIN